MKSSVAEYVVGVSAWIHDVHFRDDTNTSVTCKTVQTKMFVVTAFWHIRVAYDVRILFPLYVIPLTFVQ